MLITIDTFQYRKHVGDVCMLTTIDTFHYREKVGDVCMMIMIDTFQYGEYVEVKVLYVKYLDKERRSFT